MRRNKKGQFVAFSWRQYVAAFWIAAIVCHLAGLALGMPQVARANAVSKDHFAEINKMVEQPIRELKSEPDFDLLPEPERKELVRIELERLGAPDVETFLRIGKAESSYRATAVPPVEVRHCQRTNGTYYVVEVLKGRQDSCRGTDKQVYAEKSYGIFQILPSTAKRVCQGLDLTDWKLQVRCAIQIQERSGFTQWTTF